MSLPENIKQELETLVSAVEKAAIAREGSFSQRNPLLGPMVRCKFCHARRRQYDFLPCCTAAYSSGPFEAAPAHPKRKNPRLTRNHPPLFEMRQKLLELESEPLLIGPLQDSIEGLKGFHTPQKEVEMHHLATFVERMIIREKKQQAKKYRDMQKRSRKINRRK